MPTELRPSSDFFTDVRRILADARHTAYTAVKALSDFPKPHPSKIHNQQSPIINPLFNHCRTFLHEELMTARNRDQELEFRKEAAA